MIWLLPSCWGNTRIQGAETVHFAKGCMSHSFTFSSSSLWHWVCLYLFFLTAGCLLALLCIRVSLMRFQFVYMIDLIWFRVSPLRFQSCMSLLVLRSTITLGQVRRLPLLGSRSYGGPNPPLWLSCIRSTILDAFHLVFDLHFLLLIYVWVSLWDSKLLLLVT